MMTMSRQKLGRIMKIGSETSFEMNLRNLRHPIETVHESIPESCEWNQLNLISIRGTCWFKAGVIIAF
jgi:hypothetical protein